MERTQGDKLGRTPGTSEGTSKFALRFPVWVLGRRQHRRLTRSHGLGSCSGAGRSSVLCPSCWVCSDPGTSNQVTVTRGAWRYWAGNPDVGILGGRMVGGARAQRGSLGSVARTRDKREGAQGSR